MKDALRVKAFDFLPSEIHEFRDWAFTLQNFAFAEVRREGQTKNISTLHSLFAVVQIFKVHFWPSKKVSYSFF